MTWPWAATFYFSTGHPSTARACSQPILDERADEAQRNALFYILSGEDQPVGTMFQIFSVNIESIKDPVLAKDRVRMGTSKKTSCAGSRSTMFVRARTAGRYANPVTDREEQMILVLPKGWVFHEGRECSRLRQRAWGRIKFDLNGSPQPRWRTSPGTRTVLLHTCDEYKLKFGRPLDGASGGRRMGRH